MRQISPHEFFKPHLPWALSAIWRYAHGVVTTGDTPPLMFARGPGAGVWPGQTASHRAEKTPTIGRGGAFLGHLITICFVAQYLGPEQPENIFVVFARVP